MASGTATTTTTTKLEAAIRLKYAIDRISTYCRPIGEVVNLITKREDRDDDEEEEEEERDSQEEKSSSKKKKKKTTHKKKKELTRPFAEMLRDLVTKPPFIAGRFDKTIDNEIEVNGSKIIAWDEKTANELFEQAEPSPFGNNKTMKTEYNEEVRKAREITKFTVSDEVIKKVEQLWKDGKMLPEARAEPYKINAYGKGGHFK